MESTSFLKETQTHLQLSSSFVDNFDNTKVHVSLGRSSSGFNMLKMMQKMIWEVSPLLAKRYHKWKIKNTPLIYLSTESIYCISISIPDESSHDIAFIQVTENVKVGLWPEWRRWLKVNQNLPVGLKIKFVIFDDTYMYNCFGWSFPMDTFFFHRNWGNPSVILPLNRINVGLGSRRSSTSMTMHNRQLARVDPVSWIKQNKQETR